MKNQNENLIFENFESRLDVKFSPDIEESKRGFDKSDWILADLLIWLKSFNELILEVRKEIGLLTPYIYPKDSNVEQLIKFIFDAFGYEKMGVVMDKAKQIVEHYHLTDNWEFSIEMAILTHTLLIPPKEVPIRIHFPAYAYPEEKEAENSKNLKNLGSLLSSPQRVRMGEVVRVTGYPAIYLTKQVSVDELKKWINNNRGLIRSMQYKLPKRKIIKRDQNTLLWGKMAWILKQDGVHSWAKMSPVLDQMIQREENNSDTAPGPVELEKYYNRFVESLRKLETS